MSLYRISKIIDACTFFRISLKISFDLPFLSDIKLYKSFIPFAFDFFPIHFTIMTSFYSNSKISVVSLLIAIFLTIGVNGWTQNTSNHGNKFEQIDPLLPAPNQYRSWDGSPGPDYWQQRCDYKIKCSLDADKRNLAGEEDITYTNNSPNTLRYLWLQLDENQHSTTNSNQYFDPSSIKDVMSEADLRSLEPDREVSDYGVNIEEVSYNNGQPLEYMINQTIMRIILPEPLASGEQFSFHIKWSYNVVDRIALMELNKDFANYPRGGYEYFPKDGNDLYTITQWYPRLCAYTDARGWQTNQFTGQAEFALTFGDFEVEMTVPSDFVVGSTGECQNYEEVLSPTQLERWEEAQSASEPLEIVTLEEAMRTETSEKSTATKTWVYHAKDVRDFAWTASRKFIWDAMPHTTSEGKKVMCMSYYGKEAYPIYRRYSTKAVIQTLVTYSNFTIPYPYPVAISVEANNGMEYPMICFNPGRAEEDGTYSEGAKNAAISVIIHEVGHNYFPMIINSDERAWTWMDEGLNSFVQYLAEAEFDNNYDHGFGPTTTITDYMSLPKRYLEPIMTNGENLVDFGSNAYTKPAAGLNILRETIMGRELFDFAFKEYCRRWAFKSPSPADFFRSMEDASGMDLDWFWRGWFYSIDATDISLDSIKWYKADLETDPEPFVDTFTQHIEEPFEDIGKVRNRESGMKFTVDEDPELQDFYTYYEPWETSDSIVEYVTYVYDETYSPEEKEELYGSNNYYELHFSNKGGLVMPVIIEWTYDDGSTEMETIPVQIWRKNEHQFSKVFIKDKVVTGIRIDPMKQTADIDESNNNWPVKEVPTRFQVFKANKQVTPLNPMQKAKKKDIRP